MKKMILGVVVAIFVTGTALYAKSSSDCCAKKKACCYEGSACCK